MDFAAETGEVSSSPSAARSSVVVPDHLKSSTMKETLSFSVRHSRSIAAFKQTIVQRRNAFSPGLAVRSFARFEKRPFGVVYSFEGYAVNGRTIEPIIPRLSSSE